MKLIFSPLAMKQWENWKRTNPVVAKRIKRLLTDIVAQPYTGIGKPEAVVTEMYVEGFKAKLKKDTSYKGLWIVSFTLKEL